VVFTGFPAGNESHKKRKKKMNTVLVTGATGFLGRQLALRLAQDGQRVHILYRSEAKLKGLEHENIHPFGGNLGDSDSIVHAMEGCNQVYHVAAFALPWAKNSQLFYDENVRGTEHVLFAAKKLGVEKLVFTSSAGVLGPSTGEPKTEETIFKGQHFTHYDRSKAMAEEKVIEYTDAGRSAVIVNPTRIYGPGYIGKSNAVTMMIVRYLQGKWRYIPGDGSSIGNFVFVEDVVDCHLLAMEKGRSGERYLAGSENLSFSEFFRKLAMVSGKEYRLFRIPVRLMTLAAAGMLVTARITGRTPPIVPDFVRRYNHDWLTSSNKAISELGYSPISIEEGLARTIKWFENT
jgi:nucleoside-diphosphate-sugar epimerase